MRMVKKRRLGHVPQNIHFKDFWSRTFCRVGGRVSSAIGVVDDCALMAVIKLVCASARLNNRPP